MPPVADRNLGNSVGAIESVARGLGVSHTSDACGWGRFGFSLPLGTSWPPSGGSLARSGALVQDTYLGDSASSHILLSNNQPCMCKYTQFFPETADGSLNQLSLI